MQIRYNITEKKNPFSIKNLERTRFVFSKNLSSAYFKERPDTTRAQLPIRDEFEEISLKTV